MNLPVMNPKTKTVLFFCPSLKSFILWKSSSLEPSNCRKFLMLNYFCTVYFFFNLYIFFRTNVLQRLCLNFLFVIPLQGSHLGFFWLLITLSKEFRYKWTLPIICIFFLFFGINNCIYCVITVSIGIVSANEIFKPFFRKTKYFIFQK